MIKGMAEIPKRFYAEAKEVSEALGGTGAIPALEKYAGKEVIAEVYCPKTEQTYLLLGVLLEGCKAPLSAFGITGTKDDVSDGRAVVWFHVNNLRKLLVPCERVPDHFMRTQDNLEGKVGG